MTQGKILQSYQALMALTNNEWPVRTAYGLFNLRKAMQPIIEFRIEEERKLIAEYSSGVENGKTVFDDPEKEHEYTAKIVELNETEVTDLNFEPVKLPVDCDVKLTPDLFGALEGFVFMDL